MPGPADDLKDKVRALGMSDPMMQIGSAMERFGGAVQEKATEAGNYARRKAEEYGLLQRTPQGTTKGTAPKAQTAKRVLKRISVEPSDNGGFIATHHYKPAYGGTPSPKKHTFSDYDALHAHLEKATAGGEP